MRGIPELYPDLSELLNTLEKYATSHSSIHVLCDENTYELCWPALAYASEWFAAFPAICIPAGEDSKSSDILCGVWESLLENGADRQSLLLNLGGGVVCDLGGFAASTYMRGIDYINIPTSLLAMVDAAVGGKTGIDVGGFKNMAGTFAEPLEVIIHTAFLETLPKEETRSGFAEMLKHALLQGEDHWKQLKILDPLPEILAPYILDSAKFKHGICSADLKESGLREQLNLGHTYGHALESYFFQLGKPIPHGFAVAWGLEAEAVRACQRGEISLQYADDISQTIRRLFGEAPKVEWEELERYWRMDKKNKQGEVKWIHWR